LGGEYQQQAGRCKKAFFVAVSLKAGAHFHAFLLQRYGVTLEASKSK
jgi:hypothetical protein